MPTRKIGDLPAPERCRHPDHDPPAMICLPPGIYEHECAGCGRKIVFRVPGPDAMRAGWGEMREGKRSVLMPLVVPPWYVRETHENRDFPAKVPPL